MYHYFDSVRNTHGEVLTGFFVKCVNTTDATTASLYSDANLTPIATVSGLANSALVDADGNLDFYVGSGTYHLDYYAPDGVSFVKRIQNVPMTQNIFDTSNTVTTVSGLPAAGTAGRRAFVTDATLTTFASAVVGGGSNKVPVYDDGAAWRIG